MPQNMNALTLGVHCTDPTLLERRVLVSNHEILDPQTAEDSGYGRREVIVPVGVRKPTAEELTAIVATEETRHVIRLVSLPAEIGRRAVELCKAPMKVENYVDLGGGFMGAPMAFRYDKPDQLNVSVDDKEHKVGSHIDTWKNPDLRLAAINKGPGKRWHHLTPDFSRDDMNGQRPTPEVREQHLRDLQASGQDPLAYWFLLEPPRLDASGELVVDALAPSPVARYLHDGSTLGARVGSTAVFAAVPPEMSFTAYPSLV